MDDQRQTNEAHSARTEHEMAARNLPRPTKVLTEKQQAVGDVIKDATASVNVEAALDKLVKHYGIERVALAVCSWLEGLDV